MWYGTGFGRLCSAFDGTKDGCNLMAASPPASCNGADRSAGWLLARVWSGARGIGMKPQCDAELGSARSGTAESNVPTLGPDEVPGDGETKTRATGLSARHEWPEEILAHDFR